MEIEDEILAELEKLEVRAGKVGLTIASLCKLADVSPVTFNRWKSGVVGPSVRKMKSLQRVVARHERLIAKNNPRPAPEASLTG